MNRLWSKTNNSPDYTNMLYDAKHKAKQGLMPIINMQLVPISAQVVLATDQSPLTTLVWEGNLPVANMRDAWKVIYTESENQ